MEREVRPPEWILEELYQVGKELMVARARERGGGPPSDWGKGNRPPSAVNPRREERAAHETVALRDRFEELAREFLHAVEAL